MRYVIGLDGGGSKLSCVLADETGHMIGSSVSGPTNTSYNTPAEVDHSITSAITELLTTNNIHRNDVAIVYGALPATRELVLASITKNLHKDITIRLHAECVLSLFGAIQLEYGAIVQAGTGSFANVRTVSVDRTVGGWGPLLGDEGSGYYIGRRALTACTKMADGYEPFTTMQQRLLDINKQATMRDLCTLIYSTPSNKQSTLIASFCPIVGKCASEGDQVARVIVEEAAELLSIQTAAALKGLEISPGFPLSVAGGAWKTSPLLFHHFSKSILKRFPKMNIQFPLFEPVIGGVLMGLRDLGFPVTEHIDDLKKQFAAYSLAPELFQLL